MKYQAVVVSTLGLYISFLVLISGNTDFSNILSTNIITGYFGYIQKDRRDDCIWSDESIIVIILFVLSLISFFKFDNTVFIHIAQSFGNAISGFFGVSIGVKLINSRRSTPTSKKSNHSGQ